MTTTISPRAVIFDINGVLLATDRKAALAAYLREKAQEDSRINIDWQGDVEALVHGLLHKFCPLCDFKLCKLVKLDSTPHLWVALIEGKVNFEGVKVALTQMLTHHVHCPPAAQITLDYVAEFLTRPDLWMSHVSQVTEGVALLRHMHNTAGAENLFILSNMASERFSMCRAKFPDIFDLVPEGNTVLSGHTGVCKPRPEAFTSFISRYSLTPAQTLLIDDGAKNIQAARDAGMYAVQFSQEGSNELTAWYTQLGFEK